MKKLLIGLTLLASISSIAGTERKCRVFIADSYGNTVISDQWQEIIQNSNVDFKNTEDGFNYHSAWSFNNTRNLMIITRNRINEEDVPDFILDTYNIETTTISSEQYPSFAIRKALRGYYVDKIENKASMKIFKLKSCNEDLDSCVFTEIVDLPSYDSEKKVKRTKHMVRNHEWIFASKVVGTKSKTLSENITADYSDLNLDKLQREIDVIEKGCN